MYTSGVIREGDRADLIASRAVHLVGYTNLFGSTDRLFLVPGTRGAGFTAYRGSDGMKMGVFASSSGSTEFVAQIS